MLWRSTSMVLASAAWGALTSAVAAAPLPAFEYHGYMRSGIGASRGGADQACFGAPGASAKFRLGNECETYLEASFTDNHPVSPELPGAVMSTHITLAALSEGRHDWEPSTPEASGPDIGPTNSKGYTPALTLALPEAYVQAIGMLGSAKPWVGKRYYRRENIDEVDYWIVNNVGPGAGIEAIDLGAAKLSLAVTRNTISDHDDAPPQDNPDVRLTDIDLGSGGKLELIAIYGATGSHGHTSGNANWEPVSGEQFGIVDNIKTDRLENNITLQYGRAIFGGDGPSRANLLDSYGADASHAINAGDSATLAARNQSFSYRLVDQTLLKPSKAYSAFFLLLYQDTNFGGYKESPTLATPHKGETMIGTKHVWQFTPVAALAGEYGYNNVVNAFAVQGRYRDATLHKWTVSPQVSANGFWGRPQLRLFFTYAAWNTQSEGKIGGPVYASAANGFSTGAQFESWW